MYANDDGGKSHYRELAKQKELTTDQRLFLAEKQWRHILEAAKQSQGPLSITALKMMSFEAMGLESEDWPDFWCFLCKPFEPDVPMTPPDCTVCVLQWEWSGDKDQVVQTCTAHGGLYNYVGQRRDATDEEGIFIIEEIYKRILNKLQERNGLCQ